MKSLKNAIAFLLLQGCCLMSFSQVSLEHSFTLNSPSIISDFESLNEPIGYFCVISNDHQINMYNSDYSLYKTINVNLPQGYTFQGNSQLSSLGKHIVNTDDKVELFISAQSSLADDYTHAMIINEDGQIIFNFDRKYLIYFSGIIKVNDQIKMLLQEYLYDPQTSVISYAYSVYSCFGNYSPNNAKEFSSYPNMTEPYPNPAINVINLPYKLEQGKTSVIRIYNLNGQIMDSYPIGSDFEIISIDVSRYTKGVYTYEYNGISNVFIVQ